MFKIYSIVEYAIRDYCDERYVGYDYQQVDFDTDKVICERKILIKKIFFFKKYLTEKYTLDINKKVIINYVDVKQKNIYYIGINKEEKKIYWRYIGSNYYK